MPRLRVLAGPTPHAHNLTPIQVNSGIPLDIISDVFEGQVAVYIKGFASSEAGNAYFERKERKGVTWSIQVQGRFLQSHSADDVLFGNVFERPLKLPWGFGAALKFMKYIDPTLEQDLASKSKPWALSPLVATMPYMAYRKIESAEHEQLPAFPSAQPIADDLTMAGYPGHTGKRRTYFESKANRREVVFGPQDLITTDFCYDYLHFEADGSGVALKLPGGIRLLRARKRQ